jgi:hypothetical protein
MHGMNVARQLWDSLESFMACVRSRPRLRTALKYMQDPPARDGRGGHALSTSFGAGSETAEQDDVGRMVAGCLR